MGPEADLNDVDIQDFRGLDALGGAIVATHYDRGVDAELTELAKRYQTSVIGIPEDAGVFVSGDVYRVIGNSAVALIDEAACHLVAPGETLKFAV